VIFLARDVLYGTYYLDGDDLVYAIATEEKAGEVVITYSYRHKDHESWSEPNSGTYRPDEHFVEGEIVQSWNLPGPMYGCAAPAVSTLVWRNFGANRCLVCLPPGETPLEGDEVYR
jgi:hypothetical protein